MAYSFAPVGCYHQAVSGLPSLCLGILAMVGRMRLPLRCSRSTACFLQPCLRRRSAQNSGHEDRHARAAGAPCFVVCDQECVDSPSGYSRKRRRLLRRFGYSRERRRLLRRFYVVSLAQVLTEGAPLFCTLYLHSALGGKRR